MQPLKSAAATVLAKVAARPPRGGGPTQGTSPLDVAGVPRIGA